MTNLKQAAPKFYDLLDDATPWRLPPEEEARAASLTVTARAVDAAEAADLLRMLGVISDDKTQDLRQEQGWHG